MKKTISFNSKFGWITAFEEKEKITIIKFSKIACRFLRSIPEKHARQIASKIQKLSKWQHGI